MNDKCSRCEEVDAFPYWENRPVCYACYFLFVGEYKVEMHTQLTQLQQENERLQKQVVELRGALEGIKRSIPDAGMYWHACIMEPNNKQYDQYRGELNHLFAVDLPSYINDALASTADLSGKAI